MRRIEHSNNIYSPHQSLPHSTSLGRKHGLSLTKNQYSRQKSQEADNPKGKTNNVWPSNKVIFKRPSTSRLILPPAGQTNMDRVEQIQTTRSDLSKKSTIHQLPNRSPPHLHAKENVKMQNDDWSVESRKKQIHVSPAKVANPKPFQGVRQNRFTQQELPHFNYGSQLVEKKLIECQAQLMKAESYIRYLQTQLRNENRQLKEGNIRLKKQKEEEMKSYEFILRQKQSKNMLLQQQLGRLNSSYQSLHSLIKKSEKKSPKNEPYQNILKYYQLVQRKKQQLLQQMHRLQQIINKYQKNKISLQKERTFLKNELSSLNSQYQIQLQKIQKYEKQLLSSQPNLSVIPTGKSVNNLHISNNLSLCLNLEFKENPQKENEKKSTENRDFNPFEEQYEVLRFEYESIISANTKLKQQNDKLQQQNRLKIAQLQILKSQKNRSSHLEQNIKKELDMPKTSSKTFKQAESLHQNGSDQMVDLVQVNNQLTGRQIFDIWNKVHELFLQWKINYTYGDQRTTLSILGEDMNELQSDLFDHLMKDFHSKGKR